MSFPSLPFDGKMMNRSNSPEPNVPSMMSSVGLQDNSRHPKPSHLWDWETVAQNPNTTIHDNPQLIPTDSIPLFDCPPPLLPMNSLPFYSPPVAGVIKREEGGGRVGLNLGHRTYFPSGGALAVDRLFARSRGLYTLTHYQPPRCQAEGCKADLSNEKQYHRRHKVCEFHSKAAVVIAGGMHQRFCQQCSRFHVLAEFDESKRSCRKRLADHNRRRRKPQLPTTEDSSAPTNPTTTSTEMRKHNPKPTTDISTRKSRTSLEGHRGYQKKATHLRIGPDLSLGGVGAVESWPQSLYQHSHKQLSSSSNNYFNNHSPLCSTSNEASQSTGRGSDHQQSSLLHLGKGMFEVDFM